MLAAAALIWGCAFAAQSSAMAYVGPWTFICVRSLLASVSLFLLMPLLSRRKKENAARERRDGIRLGLIMTAACALQQYGIMYSTAGKAGFLTALYIVIVPLLSVFLKERVEGRIWISVCAASAGLYFLSFRETMSFSRGDILLLICAVCYAVYIMAIDRMAPENDSVHVSCWQFLTASAAAFAMMLVFENFSFRDILAAKGELLYAGILSSAGGYTLQIMGQKNTDPASAGMLMSLESVFALLGGMIFLHETAAPSQLFGCALIFGAILFSQLPRKT